MSNALALDPLRFLGTADLQNGLLATGNPVSTETSNNTFQQTLELKLETGTGLAPPELRYRERDAATIISSINLANILRFDAIYRLFADENPESAEVLANKVGELRNAIARGEMSPQIALNTLRNYSEGRRDLVATLNSLNLMQRLREDLQREALEARQRENFAQIAENTPQLEQIALNNILFSDRLNQMNADIWVQQIWPIEETNSIFRKSEIEIPYNPDKGRVEGNQTSGEVSEWDREFEAEWLTTQSTNINEGYSGTSSFNSSIPQANPVSAKEMNNFQPVPNGDQLFAQLVKYMELNLDRGNYQMSLELYPEHLGSLKMKVSLKGDTLNARFLVDNEAAQNLLLSHLEELRQTVSKYGISLADIKIAVTHPVENSEEFSSRMETRAFRMRSASEIVRDSESVAYFKPQETAVLGNWII